MQTDPDKAIASFDYELTSRFEEPKSKPVGQISQIL